MKSSVDAYENCPVCSGTMKILTGDVYLCKSCGYLLSKQKPGAGAEVVGIDDVRERNAMYICNIIKQRFPHAKTILDVGCSRGVFLKTARDDGYDVTGIEPDREIADEIRAGGYTVLDGFFPDSPVLTGQYFDVIIFNDSFEHIPDFDNTISGIKNHLNANGLLIINIPTSNGLMYSISLLLNKIGISTMYSRLWQNGFASPHVHYFHQKNMELLFRKKGFTQEHTVSLRYYTIKGLWKRLICKSSFLVSIVTYCVLVILYPLFVIKSDCFASFFTIKPNEA